MKYLFIFLIVCTWSVQSKLEDLTLLFKDITEQDLFDKKTLVGESKLKGESFYDQPIQSPGNYWYVDYLQICKAKSNKIKLNSIVINIRNSKTNDRKAFGRHGLKDHPEDKCDQIWGLTPQNCISGYQIATQKNTPLSLKFFYKQNQISKTFGNGGSWQEPVYFGNKCLSGIYGSFFKGIKQPFSKSNKWLLPPYLLGIGFYYNELYQNLQVVKLTGSWKLQGSGTSITNGLSRSIVNTKGESQTSSKTSGYTIGASVSVGYSFAGFGAKATISASTTQSQTAQKEVNSQLQEGITENCGSTCQASNEYRVYVYQWVWDIATEFQNNNLASKTCHFVCNSNPRKPPVCEPLSCKDKECTECYK